MAFRFVTLARRKPSVMYLIIPFVFFNMIVFLLTMPLTETVFTIPLVSDRQMPVAIGDLIVAIGMLLLYVEVVTAVRTGGRTIMDHMLAFILFAAITSELAFVSRARSPTLLLLAVLGFVDFIAGVSIRLNLFPSRRARAGENRSNFS